MAQKNFRAMAQTLIFWVFEPWLKPTFDMQILTSFVATFYRKQQPNLLGLVCCLRFLVSLLILLF